MGILVPMQKHRTPGEMLMSRYRGDELVANDGTPIAPAAEPAAEPVVTVEPAAVAEPAAAPAAPIVPAPIEPSVDPAAGHTADPSHE